MIFVTLGTEKMQFKRLINWIEQALDERVINEEVFIQAGATQKEYVTKCKGVTQVDYIKYVEMKQNIEKASVIIGHCGVGTFLTITSLDRTPILVPRVGKLGEHLDEHQEMLAKRLERVFNIPIARSYEQLVELLKNGFDERKVKSYKKELIDYLDTLI